MQIVTPEIKDKVLFYLCSSYPLEEFLYVQTPVLTKETETEFNNLSAILRQFEKMNFLRDLAVGEMSCNFRLNVELHDFAQKAGFIVREQVFEANINKLLLEVDNLKKELSPDKLEITNKISAIAAAIFAGLGLLHKGDLL